MNMRALSLSSALLIAASSCGLEEQTTDSVDAANGVVEEVPDSGATRSAAPPRTRPALLTIPSDIFNAIPEKNATRTAFFGDLHVHTTYSLDAFNVGTMATPYDAYRYASGDTIKHPAGFDMRLRVPLDFYAVTDHAMYLGMLYEAADPSTELNRIMNSDYMEDFNAPENLLAGRFGILGRFVGYARRMIGDGTLSQDLVHDVINDAWKDTVAAAEQYNKPGDSRPLLLMSTRLSQATAEICIATLSFETPINFLQCPFLHYTVEIQKTYGTGWMACGMRGLNPLRFHIIRTVPMARCSSL